MIVVNQVKCNRCEDTPFSKNRHDFKYCKCGNIAVDGGQDYLRRAGAGISERSYTEMSYELPDAVVRACEDAVVWAKETKRNDFGIAIAVLRALKDNNRLITDEMLAGQPWLRTYDGKL
jgi:hypothetical protein